LYCGAEKRKSTDYSGATDEAMIEIAPRLGVHALAEPAPGFHGIATSSPVPASTHNHS
jgi:hypothetical protein